MYRDIDTEKRLREPSQRNRLRVPRPQSRYRLPSPALSLGTRETSLTRYAAEGSSAHQVLTWLRDSPRRRVSVEPSGQPLSLYPNNSVAGTRGFLSTA